MSWMVAEAESIEDLLGRHEGVGRSMHKFLGQLEADEAVPSRLRELCRAQIEVVHGQQPIISDVVTESVVDALKRGELTTFAGVELAALSIASNIPYNHHAVSDADVTEVTSYLGEQGCVTLLTQCAFWDVQARWRATLGLQN